MILRTGNRLSDRNASTGFTLIELVLVMAILIVVLSVSGASLTAFFKGRTLEAEGKRFLALTRYAQNRAVSEGLPVVIWIDERAKKYGLEVSEGFAEVNEKPTEFSLGRDLEFDLQWASGAAIQKSGNKTLLRFRPDKFFDENNPDLIIIKEPKGESVAITPSRNRLYYEISTNQTITIRK